MDNISYFDHDLHVDSIESHLSAMDSPTHPWYLSTKAMFRAVNKATNSLSINRGVFEQSLYGITELTKFINNKTARGVLYINLEKAQSLIDKLDAIRSDQFVVLNDGHDHRRTELSTALRNLEASITEQQKLAAKYLSSKAMESQAWEASELRTAARTALEVAVDRLSFAFNQFYGQLNGPDLVTNGSVMTAVSPGQVELPPTGLLRYVHQLYHTLDAQAAAASMQLLSCAQPYVHAACQRGRPVLTSAEEWSQPFLSRAAPLVTPLLVTLNDRVQQTHAALRQHAVVGGVVTEAFERAQNVLDLVKMYCTVAISGDAGNAGNAGDTAVLAEAEPAFDAEVATKLLTDELTL